MDVIVVASQPAGWMAGCGGAAFLVQRSFSIGKLLCFACRENCVLCHTTRTEMTPPFQEDNIAFISVGKITHREESYWNFSGKMRSAVAPDFVYKHHGHAQPLTCTHANTSYSRNDTLLPLGSIHMALYNSYNGLLIVALKLFKKQYKRK